MCPNKILVFQKFTLKNGHLRNILLKHMKTQTGGDRPCGDKMLTRFPFESQNCFLITVIAPIFKVMCNQTQRRSCKKVDWCTD